AVVPLKHAFGDVGEDRPAVVLEEVPERVRLAREVPVEGADHGRDAPAGKPLAEVGRQLLVGLDASELAEAALDVMAAVVEHGVRGAVGLAGDLGADAHAADPERDAMMGVGLLVEAPDCIGIDPPLLAMALEEARDRVVGDDPSRIDDGGPYETAVDLGAIAEFREVARRRGEPPQELLPEGAAAEATHVLDRHRRVPEDLHRLEAGV